MGFEPPPLVWETLGDIRRAAAAHPGGVIDLTIGTPIDDPPEFVGEILARDVGVRGYPASVGSLRFREAAAGWLQRRFEVKVEAEQVAATIGSKEFVAGVPAWLRLRRPERDTVLFPAVSYPTYAMGAQLAGCRAVPVLARPGGALDLESIGVEDAARAVCLWSNSPSNPTGLLDDLAAVARWGRSNGVPVLSDECYAELTWAGRPRTILEHGDMGVLAVHSLSKRSNLAGARAGFYAGDLDLVSYLSQVRKHAGFMVPGPIQAVAAAAWDDDGHAEVQAERYHRRLVAVAKALTNTGLATEVPAGGFYLWVESPGGDGIDLCRRLAKDHGVLATPGSTYGPKGNGFARLALVIDDDTTDDLIDRLVSRNSADR